MPWPSSSPFTDQHRLARRYTFLWITLFTSHGLDVTRDVTINTEGTLDAWSLRWRKDRHSDQAIGRVSDNGHSSLMRRGSDWTSISEAGVRDRRSDNRALKLERVEGHRVHLAGSSDNATTPPPHDGFGDDTQFQVAPDNDADDIAANASGKSTVLARTNQSSSDLVGVNLSLFHYEALVTDFKHNIATINEVQWPENFCVNLKMVAPRINRAIEHRHPPERCILLLGGDDSDGSFNIYIDEFDQVGMGVMGQGDPEETDTEGTGPLETRFENNSIKAGHLCNLSFCYNTINGDASIWEDEQLYVSGKKIWDFPRRGKVSVFVGSHTVSDGTPKQALFPEDKAELYQIYITEGTTTTTSTTPLPMWLATSSEPNWEEVDVDAMESSKGSKWVMERTTTTTSTTTTSTTTTTTTTILPHLHQFADNATIKTVNRTVETVTDRTVVTETVDGKSKSTKQVVTMPDAVQEGMPATTNGSHHVTWQVIKTVER